MKKRHSTVLQNAWGQKNKHSHWKNNSGLKNPINSYEKRHSTVLRLKNHVNSYEKRHSTVLQNAWRTKKQTLSLNK